MNIIDDIMAQYEDEDKARYARHHLQMNGYVHYNNPNGRHAPTKKLRKVMREEDLSTAEEIIKFLDPKTEQPPYPKAAQKVTLAEQTFHSKEKLKNWIRGQVKYFKYREFVDEIDVHNKLSDLLSYHPEAEEKIGPGINYFKVVQNHRKGQYNFQVVRTDGLEIDFSWKKCVANA